MELEVGDEVIYKSGSCGISNKNPLWGGKYGNIVGRVTEIDFAWIRVNWGNGTENNYIDGDLEFYCTKKSRPNCFKCKKRLQCVTRGII